MIDPKVASGLRLRGIDVLTAQEAGKLSGPDHEHLAFATQEERAIFTMDQDYLILHSQSNDHAGIVYAPQSRRPTVGECVRSLCLIHSVITAEEMVGHLEFI